MCDCIADYVKSNLYKIQAEFEIKPDGLMKLQNRFGSPNVARPYLKGTQLFVPYSLSLSAGYIDIETEKIFPEVWSAFADAEGNRKKLNEVLDWLNKQLCS